MKRTDFLAYTYLALAVLATPFTARAADASQTTQTFIKDAVIGNTFEVEAGNIVVKKTRNNDVKNFAQRMVTDHSQANNTLNDELKTENLAGIA
jgi:putative membrane protein